MTNRKIVAIMTRACKEVGTGIGVMAGLLCFALVLGVVLGIVETHPLLGIGLGFVLICAVVTVIEMIRAR